MTKPFRAESAPGNTRKMQLVLSSYRLLVNEQLGV
jgi:hypothetical protein